MKEVKIRVPTLEDLFPKDFREHMSNAYRELLLALRKLIEREVERVERREIKKIEIR